MIDLRMAVQQAIFDALSVSEVTELGPVFQHVPDKQQPPFTVIGDIVATPAGGKDGGLDRYEVEILTVVRKPSRKPLFALMAAQRDVLDGQKLTADGADFDRPSFVSADDALLDDGKTYTGSQRFALLAQPS